jgi:hypothetical protein
MMTFRYYERQSKIVAGGIFVDTTNPEVIIEYSMCRQYIRLINIKLNKTNHWVLSKSTSVRKMKTRLALLYFSSYKMRIVTFPRIYLKNTF